MDVSVVCPFFNEAAGLARYAQRMVEQLHQLNCEWELILVDDGSTDGSRAQVEPLAAAEPRLTVLGYAHNRGRGFALRTGIAAARGAIIVTTEIDLSWGADIIGQMVQALRESPETDIVVASPNLPGGGYRNVPARRVWISRFGNRIIRGCMSNALTMNTGMTRAYRREAIRSLPLHEDGKEFHVEVALKAVAFGLRMKEIPAMLEWTEPRQHRAKARGGDAGGISHLILSHGLFVLSANPVRYVWWLSAASVVLSAVFLLLAVSQLLMHVPSGPAAILSLSLLVMALLLFVLGVVLRQSYIIQRELWRVERNLLLARAPASPQPHAESNPPAEPAARMR